MIEKDDELKDLFQQKNMEDAFSPDEENWKKMAAYIKNKRSTKRRFFIYFSLLLTLGIGTTLFFIQQNKNEKSSVAINPAVASTKTEESVKANQPVNAKAMESIVPEPVMSGQRQPKKETPRMEKVDKPSIHPEKSYHDKSHSESTYSKQEESKQKFEKTTIEPIEKSKASATETTPALAIVQASKKQKSTNYVIPKQEIVEKPLAQKEIESPLNDKENHGTGAITESSPTLKPVLSKIQNNKAKQQNLSQNDAVDSDSIAIQKSETFLTDALAMKKIILFTEKPNFTSNAIVTIRDSILPKKVISNLVFLEGGLNYLLGWKTNNLTEAKGINPLLGIQYHHNVSRKSALSVGLLYTSINHLSATSHTSTTTRLKFGEEVDATVVSAQNMHYLLMPLKLNYRLSRNDFVCLGYTIAYLLDVDSKIETYSTRLNYSSTPVVSKSRGYSKGFNSYDGQIAIGYRRRVYKEFYLNGEFFYGLRDIKNNVVYKSDEFERAYGFRLTASINLWKK